MAYCAPLGIPHSEFLGWSDDDQDKALAWRVHEAEKCKRCRTTKAEWDPTQGGSRYAYVATTERCQGCEVIEMAERDLRGQEDLLGIQIGLERNDVDPSEED